MTPETIKSQLSKLKLSAACAGLDQVIAENKKAISLAWLSQLLEVELDHRKTKAIDLRIKAAGFPEILSLDNFDFSFIPKLDEPKIMNFKNLDFVSKNQILLFLGNPGTGKTHIAIALGVLAAHAGIKVFATSAKKLNAQILAARLQGSLSELFKKILSAKLWILDDWGMVSFNKDVSEEVFDLLDRRKYSSSLILTSNRTVDEWPQVFHEPVLASAAIDRLFDGSDITIFKGPSYRLKGKINISDFKQIEHSPLDSTNFKT